jgi:hypothetical protein
MAVKQVKKVADVTAVFEVSEDQWNKFVARIHALEDRVEELETAEPVVTKAKKTGRVYTDEERKAAGLRLQTARAKKLGLESAEQMRSLHLRPGQVPTKAQILEAKKAHPVLKVTNGAPKAKVQTAEAETAE